MAKIFPLNYSCHDRHFHFLQRRRRHEVLARIYGRYKVPFFPDRGSGGGGGGGGGNMCAAVLTFRSGRASSVVLGVGCTNCGRLFGWNSVHLAAWG